MAVLKSYTCSKCGGILNFDSDQEFFDCPFCGNKFDIVDFHEDEIMAQAEESLKQKAFSSAREKFSSVLDKDPTNFEALKGLVLCELKTVKLEDLVSPRIFDSVDDAALKNLIARVNKYSPDDAELFNKILILQELSTKLKSYQGSSKALTSDKTRAKVDEGLARARARRIEAANEDFHAGYVFVVIGVIIGTLIFVFAEEWNGLAILILGISVVAAMVAESSHKESVLQANPTRNSRQMKTQMDSQFNRLIKMYATEYNKILELSRTATARKPVEADPSEAKETFNEIDPDHQETVICSKCAAQLILDKKKRVYQCDHCGVAYGISLFFGMPMEKALNSMNTGRYSEAEKRFENILMVEPESFEAYLGQILCVGRWSKVSNISATDDLSKEALSRLNELFSAAKERALEADRAFFEELEKLTEMLGKISFNRGKLDELNKEVERLESEARVYSMAETASFGNHLQKRSRYDEIERFEKENRYLTHDFHALKRKIVTMKTDCVLVR